MKILFLGTSSGWPLPRLGCKCNICTSSDPKDRRLRPSILVNDHILLDAPPDIYHEIVQHNIDPTQIDTIILTHAHYDHIMGLYDLSHVYNKNPQSQIQNLKINLFATRGILMNTKKKMGTSIFAFKTVEVKALEKFDLGNGEDIQFIPVEHPVEAYAIKIKSRKQILYAPEFRSIPTKSLNKVGPLDMAVIDGSSKSSIGQAQGHESIEEGLELGMKLQAKNILFTNIGHKTDTHENLVKFVKEQGDHKFDIAFDGLKIKL